MSTFITHLNETRKLRVVIFSLLLALMLVGLAGCKTNTKTQAAELPTPDPAFADPLQDPVYEKAVMTSNPEFTEAELLKIMTDVQPVTRSAMNEVLDYLTGKPGWDRNRAYYILSKVSTSEFILSEDDQAAARDMLKQEYPQGMPTDKEFELVSKNRAAVHKGMGVSE